MFKGWELNDLSVLPILSRCRSSSSRQPPPGTDYQERKRLILGRFCLPGDDQRARETYEKIEEIIE
jgi:hypothetical protein